MLVLSGEQWNSYGGKPSRNVSNKRILPCLDVNCMGNNMGHKRRCQYCHVKYDVHMGRKSSSNVSICFILPRLGVSIASVIMKLISVDVSIASEYSYGGKTSSNVSNHLILPHLDISIAYVIFIT